MPLPFLQNLVVLSTRSESESEVAQSCLTRSDPMDCSLPGSSVHGILQARVLEWVAISFSRGSSQPRDQTLVSCIVDKHFTVWATRVSTRRVTFFFSLVKMKFFYYLMQFLCRGKRWTKTTPLSKVSVNCMVIFVVLYMFTDNFTCTVIFESQNIVWF